MKPARSDGETVEKWRTKSAEKCGLKTARRRKAFEKCGEGKPREEPVKPARRRKTFEKCGEGIPREETDQVRREERLKQAARRVGEADGKGLEEVTMLLVTKSLFSLRSNPSRHKVTLRKGFKQHFSDHHPHQDKNGACNFVIYERRKL